MPVILPVKGISPRIGNDTFIAPNATIVGDVVMGEKCSVWFNAVIREIKQLIQHMKLIDGAENPHHAIDSVITCNLKQPRLDFICALPASVTATIAKHSAQLVFIQTRSRLIHKFIALTLLLSHRIHLEAIESFHAISNYHIVVRHIVPCHAGLSLRSSWA